MINIISLLLMVFALGATETKPVSVLKVIDGDTIEVAADLGSVVLPVRVRLLYVDTPEVHDNKHGEAMDEGKKAKDFLTKLLPKGTLVKLSGPGDKFESDSYGRVLAVAWRTDEAIIGAGDNPGQQITTWVNVPIEIYRAGWSPVWRKYGDPGETMLKAMLNAQKEAEENKVGAWATDPKWMKDKSNERTASLKK
jgi:endonuclease YncB( thermonuclease family)